MKTNEFIVITGGPGSGKTSIVDALAAKGNRVMPEAGRSIIQHQLQIGGKALPWTNPTAFAEWMLSWEIRSYRTAQTMTGPVFFDRAIPDVLGYLALHHLSIPDYMHNAATHFRYGQPVFIAPPWPAIYTRDAERKQSFEESVVTFHAMSTVYTRLGYTLKQLPLASVSERVQFILGQIDVHKAC